MRIVVNDANILIDLVELHILSPFFQLDYEFHTTDLILAELYPEQQEAISEYTSTRRLVVDDLTEDDLDGVYKLRCLKPNLSEQDCSAMYQASKLDAILVTSDNLLRKFATDHAVEVHGHLWMFDNLVDGGLLSGSLAIEKLGELTEIVNPKLGLPSAECHKRIKKWGLLP